MTTTALHIHSGDEAANQARFAIPGMHLSWHDLMMRGPLPTTTGDDAWYKTRAQALTPFAGSSDGAARHLRRQDDALAKAIADASDITLWFDACLYDQLLLCCLLARCEALRAARSRSHLLCLSESPGHPRLLGFGELTGAEMASLLPRRVTLTDAHLAAATNAWRAFTATSPELWLTLARQPNPLLPYVPPAAQRLLEQLPCVRSGLDRLENEIVSAALDGFSAPVALFKQVSAHEPQPYFGDSLVWLTLNELCAGPTPLLHVRGPAAAMPVAVSKAGEPPPPSPAAWTILGTLQGMRTLWGWGDWRALQPTRRYVANVTLDGPSGWRWDRWRRELHFVQKTMRAGEPA